MCPAGISGSPPAPNGSPPAAMAGRAAPTVARGSYIGPRLIDRYESEGELPAIPPHPPVLPTAAEAETAVATLLAAGD